jgi:hypothetical protein
MINIDIANSFFSSYASASTATTESGRVEAYQGMHQYLDENVTFSDMAYNNGIKGKKVFAMWGLTSKVLAYEFLYCREVKDFKLVKFIPNLLIKNVEWKL